MYNYGPINLKCITQETLGIWCWKWDRLFVERFPCCRICLWGSGTLLRRVLFHLHAESSRRTRAGCPWLVTLRNVRVSSTKQNGLSIFAYDMFHFLCPIPPPQHCCVQTGLVVTPWDANRQRWFGFPSALSLWLCNTLIYYFLQCVETCPEGGNPRSPLGGGW